MEVYSVTDGLVVNEYDINRYSSTESQNSSVWDTGTTCNVLRFSAMMYTPMFAPEYDIASLAQTRSQGVSGAILCICVFIPIDAMVKFNAKANANVL